MPRILNNVSLSLYNKRQNILIPSEKETITGWRCGGCWDNDGSVGLTNYRINTLYLHSATLLQEKISQHSPLDKF